MEKGQHSLLCGHTTRPKRTHSEATSNRFVVSLIYLRHVWVSQKNYVTLFGTCSHMPFHVFVNCLNYLRHVWFSPDNSAP